MKKVLISLSIIGAVAAIVIGATTAYFSDTETSTGNTFTAGTLDLTMDVNGIANGTFNMTNIKPGQDIDFDSTIAGIQPLKLAFANIGSMEGWVTMKLALNENDAAYTGEFSNTINSAWNMSADEFAKLVYIKKVWQYDSAVAGGNVGWDVTNDDRPWGVRPNKFNNADTNGDGKVSLYEFQKAAEVADHNDCFFTLTNKTITLEITFSMGDAFEDVVLTDPDSAASWATYRANPVSTYKIASGGTWNVPQADGVKVDITATLDQRP